MSYICILLLLVNNPPQNWNFPSISFESESILLALLFLLFVAGMSLSFYHAFTNRKKKLIEKKLMLLFAAFVLCGFSGIWGGTYMLVHSPGWLTIFPIWNIMNGWVLLSALRGGILSEDNISDRNVELSQVISSTIIVSIVFFSGYFWLKLNWAVTFSICITWVTTLNKSIKFSPRREKIHV